MDHNVNDQTGKTSRQPWNRRHPLFSAFTFLLTGLVVATMLYINLRPYFSTFDRSRQGDLVYSMPSPSGELVAEMYGVPYGGAPGGVTQWVDVKRRGSDDLWTTKTIYRAEYQGNNHLQWENEHTLRIENWSEFRDDSVTLNIEEDIYDGWGFACKSLRMKDEYVRCYGPDE